MLFIIYSATDEATFKSNLGLPEYSYYFVLKEYRPVLERLGRVVEVLDPQVEVDALFLECKRLAAAYMPYKVHVHRITTDLWHPWVLGFDRNIFVRDFWKYLDIDAALHARGDR